MLFFQVMLLAGYSYTHYLVGRLSFRHQVIAHTTLLGLSLLLLPITPAEAWKPAGGGDPTTEIVLLLAVCVGVPYLLVASTAPLLQSWFKRAYADRSPYGLYAVSNLGSLLALMSYPFLIEPYFGAMRQTQLWSGTYGVFVAACVFCGLVVLRRRNVASISEVAVSDPPPGMQSVSGGDSRFLWLLLSACGVVVLLAATNQMCQDVAVVPLLWIVPLALYLLTFIIAFGQPRLYSRPFWGVLLFLSLLALVYLMHQDYAEDEVELPIQIAIYSLAVFACCMVCHGELFRLRPADEHLTGFYLAVSLGGALGGVFVSIVAPRIFLGYWEFHASLVLTVLLFGLCIWRSVWRKKALSLRVMGAASWLLFVGALSLSLLEHIEEQTDQSIYSSRGFFGVLRVYEYRPGKQSHVRKFYHGRITHGSQYMRPAFRNRPTMYYGRKSGVGRAIEVQRRYLDSASTARGMHMGVVGLGAGTLATYARDVQDRVRFYEINPDVAYIANTQFKFLEDSPGEIEVVLGDARISMEGELREGDPQEFDVFVIDAFSGDAIPVHLLTREAMALYLQHVRPDGSLAFHISNLHFDLRSVVLGLARHFGMYVTLLEGDGEGNGQAGSTWVVLTANDKVHAALGLNDTLWPRKDSRARLWTDDYANLLEVM